MQIPISEITIAQDTVLIWLVTIWQLFFSWPTVFFSIMLIYRNSIVNVLLKIQEVNISNEGFTISTELQKLSSKTDHMTLYLAKSRISELEIFLKHNRDQISSDDAFTIREDIKDLKKIVASCT